ncbi:hypothetical protein KL932_003809 [Ogataea haglerorum]|nr:hypothetical protein KL950_004286 [Ogataea haglerorum]KAG7738202.1 hypothetical protein KL932_003809 [Ogataea haglerorum]
MDCFWHRQHDTHVVRRQQQQREQLVDDDHEQRGRVQDLVRAVAEHSLGKCKRRGQNVEKEQLEARHKAQEPHVVVLRHDCADVEAVVVEPRDAAAPCGGMVRTQRLDRTALCTPEGQAVSVAQKHLRRRDQRRVVHDRRRFLIQLAAHIQLSVGVVAAQVVGRHRHRERAGASGEDERPRRQNQRREHHFPDNQPHASGMTARVVDICLAHHVAVGVLDVEQVDEYSDRKDAAQHVAQHHRVFS